MRTFLTIIFWLFITAYLVIALGFTSESKKSVLCSEVSVTIDDSLRSRFYSRQDIEAIIKRGGINIIGYPVTEINTRKLEELFQGKPYISRVDIYTTVNGLLSVKVIQRDPLIRIITTDGRSCYLDKEGFVMPENRKFAQFVAVANGHFKNYNQVVKAAKLDNIEDKEKYKEWFDVLQLAKTLDKDDFWRSQIVQIYLNSKGNFELFSRVGAHQIILGDVSIMQEKLGNLMILYKKGLLYEGWNNYEKIDLSYKNQVVCTKR